MSFDDGGWLRGLGVNTTGRPEAVLGPDDSVAFRGLVAALGDLDDVGAPRGSTSNARDNNVLTRSEPLRIEGRLTLDERGRAFIQGVAEDVHAGHAEHRGRLTRMGPHDRSYG